MKDEDSTKSENSSQTGPNDAPLSGAIKTPAVSDTAPRKGRKRRKESSDNDVIVLEEEPVQKRSTRARSRLTRNKSKEIKLDDDVESIRAEKSQGDTSMKAASETDVSSAKTECKLTTLVKSNYIYFRSSIASACK